MKVTESQLRKFIQGVLQENKEKTVLREQFGNLYSNDPLVKFAQAWSDLGNAVQEQVIAIVDAYAMDNGGEDFMNVVYEQNPNALELARSRLLRPLQTLGFSAEGLDSAAAMIDALEKSKNIEPETDENL
jgi:hypothetical protein